MRLLSVAPLIALAACGVNLHLPTTHHETALKGTYYGSVAADDPQAVAAAEDVLTRGGSAADAAAAAGMVLSVSLPSRAGLGGGGICLVHEADGAVRQIDFLPRTAVGSSAVVPGMVRGLATLQTRYGLLHWSEIFTRAEWLSTAGVPANSLLIGDLAAIGQTPVNASGGAAQLQLGTTWRSQGLNDIFIRLAQAGPRDFYTGQLAQAVIASDVPAASLAAYQPVTTTLDQAFPVAGADLLFSTNGGGAAAAAAWRALPANGTPAQGEANAGSTSVVVSDANGLGVGCVFTMGHLWGSGTKLSGLGIMAAAPIDAGTDNGLALAILAERGGKTLRGVFAAAGGTSAPSALAALASAAGNANTPLANAIGASAAGSSDRLDALYCPGGLPGDTKGCSAQSDPHSGGFGTNVTDPAL